MRKVVQDRCSTDAVFGPTATTMELPRGIRLDVKKWRAIDAVLYGAWFSKRRDQSRLEILNVLLKNGADTEAAHNSIGTPLIVAVRANRTDLAEALLRHGASVGFSTCYSIDGPSKMTALHFAVERNKDIDLVRLLMVSGANPMSRNSSGQTPAQRGRRLGNWAAVRKIGEIATGEHQALPAAPPVVSAR